LNTTVLNPKPRNKDLLADAEQGTGDWGLVEWDFEEDYVLAKLMWKERQGFHYGLRKMDVNVFDGRLCFPRVTCIQMCRTVFRLQNGRRHKSHLRNAHPNYTATATITTFASTDPKNPSELRNTWLLCMVKPLLVPQLQRRTLSGLRTEHTQTLPFSVAIVCAESKYIVELLPPVPMMCAMLPLGSVRIPVVVSRLKMVPDAEEPPAKFTTVLSLPSLVIVPWVASWTLGLRYAASRKVVGGGADTTGAQELTMLIARKVYIMHASSDLRMPSKIRKSLGKPTRLVQNWKSLRAV
jgi:hypothetical protein